MKCIRRALDEILDAILPYIAVTTLALFLVAAGYICSGCSLHYASRDRVLSLSLLRVDAAEAKTTPQTMRVTGAHEAMSDALAGVLLGLGAGAALGGPPGALVGGAAGGGLAEIIAILKAKYPDEPTPDPAP